MYKKGLLLLWCIASNVLLAQEKPLDPFAANNGNIPPTSDYRGALFQFNYNYPKTYTPPSKTLWQKVLDCKPITKENTHAYMMALKKYVKPTLDKFLSDPKGWNKSEQTGWYSMLWAGQSIEKVGWEGRESIYGTFTGQVQSKDVYAASGLTKDVRNYAAILYDERAAYTLHQVWKDCNQTTQECVPLVDNNETQFKEGAIVIKSSGITATPEEWPVLEGAPIWKVYRRDYNLSGTIPDTPLKVRDTRVVFIDIIVKDSVAAPQTGWVFSTFVYDKNATGDIWDKMVPLGAMWGNDPDVMSPQHPNAMNPNLKETYINPNAPEWTKVTLGYGGRLSGPFDISVKYNVEVNGKQWPKLRSSSCMSCHGTSSYTSGAMHMSTFLYPAKEYKTQPWVMYAPGSEDWNKWFQNRPGYTPQKKGTIGLDYSTLFEAVLMNYTAATIKETKESNAMFLRWKKHRDLYKH